MTTLSRLLRITAVLAISSLYGSAAQADPLVRTAAASDAAGLQATVDAFRAELGGDLNPNNGQRFDSGRREINWDGTPNPFTSPSLLKADFFNTNSPRGVVLSTPGQGLLVSRTTAQGQPRFSDINPSLEAQFDTFSPQRLFAASGSTVVETSFFLPNTTTPALERGFGAVFVDVDGNGSKIEYLGADGAVLHTQPVPHAAGSGNLSFAGVKFDTPVVAKVRITAGSTPIAAGATDTAQTDVVALDDFIYSEPVDARLGQPAPPPPGPTGPADDTGGAGGPGGTGNGDPTGTGGAGGTPGDGGHSGPGGTGEPALDRVAPALTGLRLSKKHFTRTKGTKINFVVTEASTVRFTVQRRTTGRKPRWVAVKGALTRHTKAAGTTTFGFKGKLGRRRLAAGTYRLRAVATDSAGNRSKPATAHFSVQP